MKSPGIILAILVVLVIAAYLYTMRSQALGVTELCARYPEGSPVGNLIEIAREYSAKLMGPQAVKGQPETEQAMFCAALTMCDVSCSLEIKDGVVTKSVYSSR